MDEFTATQEVNYFTEDHVKTILKDYYGSSDDLILQKYVVRYASDKMLGFLSDYWKLKVNFISKNGENQKLSFFIKAVSRLNEAKAEMVKDCNLFTIESTFYTCIKNTLNLAGGKAWSPKLISILDDAMVFEDLNVIKYKMQNKFQRFDMAHTLRALKTLARFHAATIISEEIKTKELNRQFRLSDEYGTLLKFGGYQETDAWFFQCIDGALDALRSFSKYAETDAMSKIEKQWHKVWVSSLRLHTGPDEREVICHRDLWNNNILFHYKKVSEDHFEPDDCLLVDFQAIQFQPPAADVMLMLYCNLDPKFREENMETFLNYYYVKLDTIVHNSGISLEGIIPKESFLASAEQQRQWGLIISACLLPQFWIDDELTTRIFTNSEQFDDVLNKNKGRFMKKMMAQNLDYRDKVINLLDEIVERYCHV